jgi:hypothetical protein
MKDKGRVILALIIGVACLAAFTVAYAATKMPDKDITIDSKVYEKKKKTPVVFSHPKHKELKCTTCHHEYKDGKTNVWKEGQEVKKCSSCHKDKAEGKIVKLEKAFHDQCQGCHKKLKKEKKKTGPTACTKCHPKKK